MADRRDDGDLVAATLQGDQGAFGELVARYKDAVFGVAFHRLGQFEEARDAAQETFVKAYFGLPKLDAPGSFAHWLYRIADGTAIDAARCRRDLIPLDDTAAARAARLRSSPTGDASLAARQIREALAQLPEPDRLAVVLHCVNGYSHAEVAQFLGTTAGAVKTRVSRARSKLRREMTEAVETRLKGERPVVEYHATDLRRPHTSTSGTVDDMTVKGVRQSLARQGYEVTRVRLLSPHEIERKRQLSKRWEREHELVRRLIRMALKSDATELRLSVQAGGPWDRWLRVDHCVDGKWVKSGRMATSYGRGGRRLAPREADGRELWDLARGQLAAAMGLEEVTAGVRLSGEMGFRWKGAQLRFRVRFYRKSIRLDLQP